MVDDYYERVLSNSAIGLACNLASNGIFFNVFAGHFWYVYLRTQNGKGIHVLIYIQLDCL